MAVSIICSHVINYKTCTKKVQIIIQNKDSGVENMIRVKRMNLVLIPTQMSD